MSDPAAAKLRRVDLRKLRGGGVAGHREAVALIGDALREEGAVRVEGHGGADAHDALVGVGRELLAALADYFGLSAAAFLAVERTTAAAAGTEQVAALLADALLVVLAGVAPGTELSSGAHSWRAITAHRGELLALPGGALSALTAGVVPMALIRSPVQSTAAAALLARRGGAAGALAEFSAGHVRG